MPRSGQQAGGHCQGIIWPHWPRGLGVGLKLGVGYLDQSRARSFFPNFGPFSLKLREKELAEELEKNPQSPGSNGGISFRMRDDKSKQIFGMKRG